MLVGVGGSGKQSLARLAAFISSLEVTQIQLKKGYAVFDLKVIVKNHRSNSNQIISERILSAVFESWVKESGNSFPYDRRSNTKRELFSFDK